MKITAFEIICTRLFDQPFVYANINKNLKAGGTGPLWGESNGYQWIPLTKGQ